MTDLMNFICNNGLAVGLCVYMVIINNKTVSENTSATNKLCEMVERLAEKMGNTHE